MMEIKSWSNGKILFSLETDSLKIAVEAAIRSGADLRDADLGDADLWGADLRGADLRDADLWGADLRDADLRGADLGDADLRGANLRGADLRGADLGGADLAEAHFNNTIGNGREIQSISADGLIATWHQDILSIGCQTRKIDEWLTLSDHEISSIGGDPELWKKWKPIFSALIKKAE